MKKRVFAMLMAVVMAFSLMACGNKADNGSGGATDAAETIKLGVVGPLTGGYGGPVIQSLRSGCPERSPQRGGDAA